MRHFCFVAAIVVFSTAAAIPSMARSAAKAKGSSDSLAQWTLQAVEPETAEQAIAQLRARGPAGLEALLAAHRPAIDEATRAGELEGEQLERWQRIRHAIDSVSGQRDCHASGLYWYTDFDQAQAAAKLAGKPILSLRLLGKLTDEYSCANSRFFRTTLYSNQEVAKYMRQQFILHWQTVRPVPIVTIDFGDGRSLRRTVTGNSAHYVLTPDGQPLDAIPGLYGPQAFLRLLNNAEELAHTVMAATSGASRASAISVFHTQRGKLLDRAWESDMARLRGGKSTTRHVAASPAEATDVVWNQVAMLHAASAELDESSRRLIESQHPTAFVSMKTAMTKSVGEFPLVRLVRGLQNSIALDTVRNEYLLHRRIHEWFAAGDVRDVPAFNERVYAELFLTPSDDPWLGLLPAGYTGLENNGVVAANP